MLRDAVAQIMEVVSQNNATSQLILTYMTMTITILPSTHSLRKVKNKVHENKNYIDYFHSADALN